MSSPQPEFMEYRGTITHNGTTPKMRDTQIAVANQTRDLLFKKLVDRPGTAYVEYVSRTKRVTEHGLMYTFTGEEDVKYSDEHSDTDGRRNKWHGTVTVTITAQFRVITI